MMEYEEYFPLKLEKLQYIKIKIMAFIIIFGRNKTIWNSQMKI